MECPFCDPQPKDIVFELDTCYARWDKYPVSYGHALVVPKRHLKDPLELTIDELLDIFRLLAELRAHTEELIKPDGYNVGVNLGVSAGQTVDHIHIHFIPRYTGDVQNPRGGVRNVIPDKGNY